MKKEREQEPRPYAPGERVEVCVIWTQSMEGVWVAGFEVLADAGGQHVELRGADGVQRRAKFWDVRRPKAGVVGEVKP